LADALDAHQVGQARPAQAVQVVATAHQQAFGQVEGAFVAGTRAQQNGDELRVREHVRPMLHELLPRTVVWSPLPYAELFRSDRHGWKKGQVPHRDLSKIR